MTTLSRYTVILERPDKVTRGDADDRRFMLVEADGPMRALAVARQTAFEEDAGHEGEPVEASFSPSAPRHLRVEAEDYSFIAVLSDWSVPLLRGDIL